MISDSGTLTYHHIPYSVARVPTPDLADVGPPSELTEGLLFVPAKQDFLVVEPFFSVQGMFTNPTLS